MSWTKCEKSSAWARPGAIDGKIVAIEIENKQWLDDKYGNVILVERTNGGYRTYYNVSPSSFIRCAMAAIALNKKSNRMDNRFHCRYGKS